MTPEEGRALWKRVIDGVVQDKPIENRILHHIIEAALIDHIEARVAKFDEYAIVTGTRINTLLDAITGNAHD